VNERWVCKRCYADNNESDGSCQRCGLMRGAETTEADQQAWAVEGGASPAAATPGWRRWIRFWWVPALAIVLVVGYLASARRDGGGEIAAGGTLSIADLRVGDCFDFEEVDEISEVDERPCAEGHKYELFHVATWTASGDYPSETAMMTFVGEECIPAFDRYVGTDYLASQLDFVPFTPVEDGWNQGDRVFQCALVDPMNPQLTESLEGVAR